MKKKKEQFNLKEEYKKVWNYLKNSKEFIYGIVVIFFIFALIGFFIPASESVREQLLSFMKEILAKTEGMSQFELIKFIFFNNAQSSFYGLIFGVLIGIFPLVATVLNGYFLGFVASISVQADGASVLWRLLPHGIFELPAVFISLGLGVKFGTFIFQKKRLKLFKEYFFNSLRVFFLVVIPLLIIAAIIEGSLMFLID